ncbi:MAG: glycoside hydrolase family 15 protein [Solirubrobacteraceae bacterium]
MARESRYPPIADLGLIGDCASAALLTREGSIVWCCLPRFDSGSAFASLLDAERGGECSIEPVLDSGWSAEREYLEDSLVLATTFHGPAGEFRLLDCFLLGDDEHPPWERRILRVIEGRSGAVELAIRVAPCFDYGEVRPWMRRHGLRLHSATGGNDGLVVWCSSELVQEPEHELRGTVTVKAGERAHLLLAYTPPELLEGEQMEPKPHELDAALEQTVSRWRTWAQALSLEGPHEQGVRRSGLVLKALTFAPTGAIVAAPTTGLPEVLGGRRNWDYRFAWVRDSSFSSRAFAEIGAVREADAFRRFIIRSAAGHAEDLQIVYGVGGERRLAPLELDHLEGYRGSAPVVAGNGASKQRQLDAYGELINLSWRSHRRGHSPDDDDWRFLTTLIDHAATNWAEPDQGLWEWPGDPDQFVHSKVLCWSALDRGIRLARECLRSAPIRRWTRARRELREAIDSRGYDEQRGIYLQAFDKPDLDAALLLLPTVEFVDWSDERMIRTTAAVREELDAGDGLLFRYRRDDGLPGREGAFLCCSFWLVECLARQGLTSDAHEIFDRAIASANDLGLLSEELDPKNGDLLGNFPQALTHLAHISAAIALAGTGAAPTEY